jgi:hypothetical protein
LPRHPGKDVATFSEIAFKKQPNIPKKLRPINLDPPIVFSDKSFAKIANRFATPRAGV